MTLASFPDGGPLAGDPSAARVDTFLRDRVLLKVATLAGAADCSVDLVDLEIKRGHLEIVGEGRQRRVPAQSARRWLLGLHKTRTAATRRVAEKT